MISLTFLLVISQVFILVSQTHGDCNLNIRIPNGRIWFGENHYRVLCDPGYVLEGSEFVYCTLNEWERSPPSCYPESRTHGGCSRDIYIQYGRVGYAYNTYKVHCDPGYTLDGPAIVYCVKGNWEESPPRCYEANKYRNTAPSGDRRYYTSSTGNKPTDYLLETNNNPCQNLGGCQHICKNVNGRAKCRCRNGYKLADDGKKCIEDTQEANGHPELSHLSNQHQNARVVPHNSYRHTASNDAESRPLSEDDPCYNHNCQQLCQVEKGRAQCRCQRGYILNQDNQRTCEVNTGPPVHPTNPCDKNNGGCDQKCTLIGKRQVFCSCHGGYYLGTDRRSCVALPSVPRPTSCSFNNGGCQHTCKPWGQSVTCSCPHGYRLHTDQKSCLAVATAPRRPSCDFNNGGCQHTCSMKGYSVVCSCPDGFRLHTDRKHCVALPRDTCAVNNGGCEAYCSDGIDGVECSCPRGYGLADDKKHCVDIDECQYEERLNTCHHICENTEGGYTCRCHPGYVMIDNKCEGCRKNAYWSTEKNGCVDCPSNSYTLSEGKTGVEDCFCRPGYSGSPAANIPCLDNDECSGDNFGCSHTCVNTPGGAFCSCPFGFEVDKDNKTCIDIDECSVKNGGCEGICINTNGSFHCRCPQGFKPSNKDQYSCDDVDECSENNGGCHQLCVNYRGGHYCTCKEGYRIDGSLKNCTDILCPDLPVPHFSIKKCKKNLQDLPEMDHYPTGTVCTFKCDSGFKDVTNSNGMKCREDGTWEGSLSECKSQHCPALRVPENGNVHPASCETRGNKVKQKCTFTCHQGYKLEGFPVFNCKNNLSWDKPINKIPVCQPEEIRASIECVRDIKAALLPGQSSQNVTIPEPVTNMESYTVIPNDTIVGIPTEFKAGKTRIMFTSSSPHSNRTAKCITTVHVIDEEPPVFITCPKDIVIENAKIDGEIVTWEDPVVIDNVGVETLMSSVEPNTTLIPGSYVVEYVARDAEGNTESCSFKIDVVRLSCDDLKDPIHGEANCMDWIYGRLCQPLCEDGYLRDPSESQFYSCGDSGKWEPSEKISDCLPFIETDSTQCPDGMEFKTIEETDEEICLKCPSNAVWSPTTRTCQKTT